MPRLRRFVFEDPDQKPVPEGFRIPKPREPMGDFWREYVASPHPKADPAPLRVVVEAEPGKQPRSFQIEIESEPHWIATHGIERSRGVWSAQPPTIKKRGD